MILEALSFACQVDLRYYNFKLGLSTSENFLASRLFSFRKEGASFKFSISIVEFPAIDRFSLSLFGVTTEA